MTGARTYLDHNATEPLRPQARQAMLAAMDAFGNPSSVHGEGRAARAIVEAAREQVAALVNARPGEVVFTSGATESNTIAISGRPWRALVVGNAEHSAVLAPIRRSHAPRLELPCRPDGVQDLSGVEAWAAALPASDVPAFASLALANGETGVVQPVGELVAMLAPFGVVVHSDAVQATGRIAVDFRALGLSLMSLSAHKMGGPKGIGALVVRDGTPLEALLAGGGQERRRRAGTENVIAIAGFGAAAEAARRDLENVSRIAGLARRSGSGVDAYKSCKRFDCQRRGAAAEHLACRAARQAFRNARDQARSGRDCGKRWGCLLVRQSGTEPRARGDGRCAGYRAWRDSGQPWAKFDGR